MAQGQIHVDRAQPYCLKSTARFWRERYNTKVLLVWHCLACLARARAGMLDCESFGVSKTLAGEVPNQRDGAGNP